MDALLRPAWLEIDLDCIACNIGVIKKLLLPDTRVIAVVKADAYGHGMEYAAKTMWENGITSFAVACLSEALHLKRHLERADVLIMGYTPDHALKEAVAHGVKIALYSRAQAETLSRIACELNKTAVVHIKLDTGMNRLGLLAAEEGVGVIRDICRMEYIDVEGIFSHFADADGDDHRFTHKQAAAFQYVIDGLEGLGIHIPIRHICNSIATLRFKEYQHNAVRCGTFLYGAYYHRLIGQESVRIRRAMSFKALVSDVKMLGPGELVGYSCGYETKAPTKVATLPVGFADGFSRFFSNTGECLVHNTLVPVIGRIAMDQMSLDVTGLDISIGDEVVLLGRQGDREISYEDLGDKLQQIPAFFFCGFSKRLPFVYMKDGKPHAVVDYVAKL